MYTEYLFNPKLKTEMHLPLQRTVNVFIVIVVIPIENKIIHVKHISQILINDVHFLFEYT